VDPAPNPPNVGAGAGDPKVDVVVPVVLVPKRDGAGAALPNPEVPKVDDPKAGAGAGLPNNPMPVGAGAGAPKAGAVVPNVVVDPPPNVGCCVVVDPPNKDGAGVGA
jgi:hypothetical protein